jgi:carbon storage regulator
MLVMRRRAGESFLVGDIEIQVLEVGGRRVKLGIRAPESMAIVRREVQITESENLAAAESVSRGVIDSLLSRLGWR